MPNGSNAIYSIPSIGTRKQGNIRFRANRPILIHMVGFWENSS